MVRDDVLSAGREPAHLPRAARDDFPAEAHLPVAGDHHPAALGTTTIVVSCLMREARGQALSGLSAVNVNVAAKTASLTCLEDGITPQVVAAAAEAGCPAQVVCIVTEHLREIDRKIAELQSMSITLGDLAAACSGDHRPYGRILSNLARISDG